jgi:general secretion pathway protein N
MIRALLWMIAGLLTVVITTLSSMPAVWLVPLIDQQSNGRFSLADVEGNLWRGSGVIGAAAARDEALAPLLPGRCVWRISPLMLLGVVDISLKNQALTSAPITIRGTWVRLEIGAGSISLPANGLAALGAPMNTLQPTGVMKIVWPALTLTRTDREWLTTGRVQIELTQVSSALSPIKPLGAYRLQFDWFGREAKLDLQSLSGPLMLEGRGRIVNGRLQFAGEAWAQAGHEAQLAALLGLLGQRRQLGQRIVTALEFQ